MTADRSSDHMPTGPYREPYKMEIYMNFNKNGNQVWAFCTPKTPQNGGGHGVGGRLLGNPKKAVSSMSLDGEHTPNERRREGAKEEDEAANPLMSEHNHHQENNASPSKPHRVGMVKDVEDLNMTHRDPVNMSSHVRIGFEEVFAEPDGQQSFDAIWTTSFIVYTQSKAWCYRLISAALAIPLALLWGVQFAFLTFCHIWWVVPCIRAWLVTLNWVGRIWAICIRTLCDPINDSCSRFLGNIKVQMHPPQHV